MDEILGCSPFDHVCRKGKWRTGKTYERHLVLKFLPQDLYRIKHKRHLLQYPG